MSFVVTIPEALAAVATDLAGIGSTIGTANAAAAVPTTTVLAAAADEVSAAMAALFSGRRSPSPRRTLGKRSPTDRDRGGHHVTPACSPRPATGG